VGDFCVGGLAFSVETSLGQNAFNTLEVIMECVADNPEMPLSYLYYMNMEIQSQE
jgi:hypothetical protein